jgi:hypothetical protein
MSARELDIGESRVVTVDPTRPFVPTGVLTTAGQRLRFSAAGLWKDGSAPACDAAGWNRWYASALRRFNRIPGRNYFELCATLGPTLNTARAIGLAAEWAISSADIAAAGTAAESGLEVFLFANDWPSRYGNNRALPESEGGPMRATILRAG